MESVVESHAVQHDPARMRLISGAHWTSRFLSASRSTGIRIGNNTASLSHTQSVTALAPSPLLQYLFGALQRTGTRIGRLISVRSEVQLLAGPLQDGKTGGFAQRAKLPVRRSRRDIDSAGRLRNSAVRAADVVGFFL